MALALHNMEYHGIIQCNIASHYIERLARGIQQNLSETVSHNVALRFMVWCQNIQKKIRKGVV